jgi:hypothetical protein
MKRNEKIKDLRITNGLLGFIFILSIASIVLNINDSIKSVDYKLGFILAGVTIIANLISIVVIKHNNKQIKILELEGLPNGL